MKIKSILLFLFLMGGAFLLNANAQSGYGYSLLRSYQDEFQNQKMKIEAGTILDYGYAYYYRPGLEANIYKNSSLFLHHDREIVPLGYSGIIRYLDTEAAYGDVFRLHTDHYVGAYRYYNTSQGPAFVDYWGLNYYTGNYPSPYGFIQGPLRYYSYQVYKVATTQVQLTVPRPPLHLDSIDDTGLPPGSNRVTALRGTGLFGTGQSIQVSGSGVMARIRPNQQPNTIEVLDIELDIDENAARGERQLTLTVNGVTSNALTLRVGDRSPVITGITPSQGNTGDNVNVTISGTDFGFDPQLFVDGTGVQPSRLTYTTTQIEAVMSVAQATYIGDRGVTVKSRGLTGNGFEQVPGTSDTSNAVPFRVLEVMVGIPDIPVVEKFGERTITVTVRGLVDNNQVKFTLEPVQGGSGSAQFDNNSNEITRGNGDHPLKIKGVTESNAANKMTLKARVVGSNADIAHKEFTVAMISSLVYERINTTYVDLDDNPGTDGVVNPNGSEGQRIYPDKINVADVNAPTQINRALVKINATVSPAIPDLTVFFASFDLDDPSANATPIDANGSNGNDNNVVSGSLSGAFANPASAGTCSGATAGTTPKYISKTFCTTSTTTVATNFNVTMQPGDNFTVFANLTGATVPDNFVNSGGSIMTSSGGIIHVSGKQNTDQTVGIRTNMLTVWRKLHIEVDSMGAASNNKVEGNLTDTKKVSIGTQTLNLSVNNLTVNRFENGTLVIKRGNPAVVFKTLRVRATTYVSNTDDTVVNYANTASSVTVNNNGGVFNISPSDSFTLYDDDDMNDDGVLDGDVGDVVPEPDRGLLQSVDTPCPSAVTANNCNNFASAYVRPYYDLTGNQRNVPFSEKVTDSDIDVLVQTYFQNIATEARADFWTIYLIGLYQHDNPLDPDQSDPDRSQSRYGQALTAYSSVFMELARPTEYGDIDRINASNGIAGWANRSVGARFTTAHEVGHLFGCDHFDGMGFVTNFGVMGLTSTRTVATFNDYSLDIIRRQRHP